MVSRVLSFLLLFLSAGSAVAGRGDMDPTYAGSGVVSSAAVFGAVQPLPDGRLLVFGRQSSAAPWTVTRRDLDGRPDPSFGENGAVALPATFVLNFRLRPLMTGDGRVLVAGSIGAATGPAQYDFAVLQFDASGRLASDFGAGGVLTRPYEPFVSSASADVPYGDRVKGFAIDGVGNILVAVGHYQDIYDGALNETLRRFSRDGRQEIPFGTGSAIALPARPDLVAYGRLLQVRDDGSLCVDLAYCVDAQGARIELPAIPAGLAPGANPSIVALLPDGGALVAHFSGTTAIVIQRIRRDGSLDASFGTNGALTVDSARLGPYGADKTIRVARVIIDPPTSVAHVVIVSGAGETWLLRVLLSGSSPGTLAADFGNAGVIRWMSGDPFEMDFVQQPSGSVLAGSSGVALRLRATDGFSPGFISVQLYENAAPGQRVLLRALRLAGSEGPLYASFATTAGTAAEYRDFTPTTGRLFWDAGDTGEKTLGVDILPTTVTGNASRTSSPELSVRYFDVTPGSWLTHPESRIAILLPSGATSGGTPPAAASPTTTIAGGGGGGGSFSWGLLAVLAGAVGMTALGRLRRQGSLPR